MHPGPYYILPMLKKIGFGFAALIGGTLASLAGHYLFALATGSRYNSSQWAAAGAWIGASMTASAVGAALYQSYQATKKARGDAADAKRRTVEEQHRHQEALARAEDRLAQELGAHRRTEQIQAVAVLNACLPVQSSAISSFTQSVVASRTYPGDKSATLKRAKFDEWEQADSQLMASYQSALMTVVEPIVEAEIRQFGKNYAKLRAAIRQLNRLEFHQPLPARKIESLIHDTMAHMESLVQVVRDYLGSQPKVESIDPNQLMLW